MTVHPLLEGVYNGWKRKEDKFSYDLIGKDVERYYKVVGATSTLNLPKQRKMPSRQTGTVFYFPEGTLFAFTSEPLTDEASLIFQRFTKVFTLTYRRYLDLKEAEGQAREAQIEAALERVRSRTMAMQRSNEIADIVGKIFEELTSLDIVLTRCIIWIINQEERTVSWWLANPEAESGAESFNMKYNDHPVFHEHMKAWRQRKPVWIYKLSGKLKTTWDDVIFNKSELSRLPKKVKKAMRGPETIFFSGTCNDFGILRTVSLEPLSDENVDLIQRFGRVFEQSYTRFIDVQKAEAQAKEAVKQSSLDRVRAEIASMRTADDLNSITPLIWRELTTLDVPFFRCGVFIIDEAAELVHAYLSKPSGESLAALELKFDSMPLIEGAVSHWKKQKKYFEEWDKKQFIQWTASLIERGQIQSTEKYQAGEDAPEHLVLQLVPFTQGMLYVGSVERLFSDQVELVQSLADAFAVAYARYEDFKGLEVAKTRVEDTLTDLKSAQTQLIHSEKMASLGELTAGIAHEIQNPLNFVNNFSEVNSELIDELNQAIADREYDEVEAIAINIRENEQKITHHGKRSEAIVKSMLHHSRGSSSKKEKTDINVLVDEYLRLAYHGLRAKDKSFNADFETDLDESLTKINVIPQDIGRVLLNLINNAFYAVTERKKQETEGYKPSVIIRTMKEVTGTNIEIQVKDNGSGIPKKVLVKIFQPFFSTKPTGQGTGLGLSLSYDIVKAHGGDLKVKTKVGKGTEFTVVLPVG